ncbi:uncharacterized protein LOC143922575 [Arctopsyche grandis]|uniref:uncharacterized protein LOC143922575 n=1 Tax=Arctopsyche grandis TaxID=121162 RepID=UPI00406D966D
MKHPVFGRIEAGRMLSWDDYKGSTPSKDLFAWRIRQPLLLALMAASVAGLRDIQVSVPEAAAAGDTVALHCRYDLESDILYSLKWYRGRDEFFRYIPKELPHTKVFPLEGVDVDLGRSGPSTVVLRSVSPSQSGRYRCEVSADAPSFHTAMKASYMHVVELPDSAPIIYADKIKVSVGDSLKVRCTAPPAHPPANLTWTLNGKSIKGTLITEDRMDLVPTKLYQINLTRKTHKDHEKVVDETKTNSYFDKNYGERWISSEFVANDRSLSADPSSNLEPFPTKSRTDNEIVKKSSESVLVIPIIQEVFIQNQLKIVCRAVVFSLYSAEAQLILDEDRPQIAQILGNTQNSNGSTTISTHLLAAFVSFCALVKHLSS